MNTEINYNLPIESTYQISPYSQTSFMDDIVNFASIYKEFLTPDHIKEITYIKHCTYVEGLNGIFRLLTFSETMYYKSKQDKYYLNIVDGASLKDLFIMNESIYCLRINYLNMQRDLHLLYQKHVDRNNKRVSSFLETYIYILNRLKIDFDNAQLSLDTSCIM
jgi:hypothetical protein